MVKVQAGDTEANAPLMARYGAQPDGYPFLTVLDASGKVLKHQETGSLEDGPRHDPAKVLAFLERYQAPYREAQGLLDAALARAIREEKRVFLAFEAPLCGWCHRLEARMDLPEVKPVLAKDFVACWVDVDRTVGGEKLLQRLRGGQEGGIPWFVVLDPDGRAVVDADDVLGQNLGCPHAENEVEAWGETLRRARTRISESEIARVVEAFHEAGARGDARRKAEREAARTAGGDGR